MNNDIRELSHELTVEEMTNDQLDVVSGGGIGSQSSGAGAGKVTFNPFTITHKVDKSSPMLFL